MIRASDVGERVLGATAPAQTKLLRREVVLPFCEDGDTLVAEHARWALQRLE